MIGPAALRTTFVDAPVPGGGARCRATHAGIPVDSLNGTVMTIRFYRIALAISVLVNVLLVTGIWYYRSVEDLLGLIEMIIGFAG